MFKFVRGKLIRIAKNFGFFVLWSIFFSASILPAIGHAQLPEKVWVSMSRGIEGTQSFELTLPNFRESSAKSQSWLGAVEHVGNSWRFAYTKMDTSSWREARIAPIAHFDHESGRQISPVYQTLSIGRGLTKNFGFGVASAHLGFSVLRGYGYSLGCDFVASSSDGLPVAEHCRYKKHSGGGVYFQVDASIGAFLGLGLFLRYSDFFSSIGKEIDIGISVPIGRFHHTAAKTIAEQHEKKGLATGAFSCCSQ